MTLVAKLRKHRILASVAAAVVLTAVCFFVDARRAKTQQVESSLRWARQVVSQAQGLILYARGKAYPDPLGWTVGYLAQGVEPRVLKVTKFLGAPGHRAESFEFNRSEGSLDYVRILTPEDGMGIRLKIAVDYAGFLGTRGVLASDLMLLVFFAVGFGGFFIASGYRSPSEADPSDGILRERVRKWARDAKGALTQLGINIREMVREAQHIAIAAGKSRNALGELRAKIHGNINELRESKHSLKEARAVALQAEVAALNLVLEASRLGEPGKHLGLAAEELHRLMQRMRKTHQSCESSVGKLELELEPWAIDADIAYHLFDDLFKSTQGMDGHIRATTQSVVGQAKLIQSLGQEINPEPQASAQARAQ